MNKLFFATLFLLNILFASTLSLQEILKHADKENPMHEALVQESLTKEAQKKAENAPEPLTLYGTTAKARPQTGIDTNEYSIGLSKQILFGGIEAQDNEIASLQNKADILEGEKEILSFKNSLKNLYHGHCIDRQNVQTLSELYTEFELLYAKKQNAFKIGEVSKIELLHLKMEKERLFARLKEAKAEQELSKDTLLRLSQLPQHTNTTLSCIDTYPITPTVSLKELFSLSNEAYAQRLKSAQKMMTRYSTPFESVDLSAEYDNELDMERYLVGVSLPLNFTSKRQEMKRLEALHMSNAIEARHRQNTLTQNTMVTSLQTELEYKAESIARIRSNIEEYRSELLPMLQKSYTYGESSVTEFILSKQQYYELLQTYYKAQKDYYHTLFTLFTLSETKDTL